MTHPLDRVVALALETRQAHLARGDGRARRFDPEHAFFAHWTDDAALAALVGPDKTVAAFGDAPLPAPPGFEAEHATCVQMVAERVEGPTIEPLPLGEADADAIFALARMTEPGPFFAQTHRLGRFVGVKAKGQLVAMAGERLHVPGYREVSAVCTHPDHRGQGHAAALTTYVARRILAEGETPFLHSYADNAAAIALYERLGFRVRRTVSVTLLRRR